MTSFASIQRAAVAFIAAVLVSGVALAAALPMTPVA